MYFRLFFALLLATAVCAQQPKADLDMPHMQDGHSHGGFMQSGMHHGTAKGVVLDAKSDEKSHTITLRVGPMNLPAHTPHMKMPQPADLVWTVPMAGWLLAYNPKLVDATGNAVTGKVLHHVAFWSENRSDFLCPHKQEHIFGAGGELTDWAQIPGFGYRVEKGDRIRVETMIHNPSTAFYKDVFLEISIPYEGDATPAPVRSFYPAWIDAASCGNSGYDLPPGRSKKVGSVVVKYSGTLLGVGGHMHDYGQQLTLQVSPVVRSEVKVPETETSRTEFAPASKPVAVLPARVDDHGHLLNIPVVTFFQSGGYPVAAGDKLTVSAIYNNSTGRLLRDGAMGIVVGYFVPQDPAALDALRHSAASGSESAN